MLTSGAIRKAIRNKTATLLKGNTGAKERVFPSAVYPLDEDELPAILVYTLKEKSEVYDISPRTDRRTLDLVVECAAQHDGLDDAMDDLTDDVERLLLDRDAYSDIRCIESVEYRSVKIAFSADGETASGAAQMLFEVVYITDTTVEADLVPWLRAHVEMKPENALPDTPPCIDDVNLPQ